MLDDRLEVTATARVEVPRPLRDGEAQDLVLPREHKVEELLEAEERGATGVSATEVADHVGAVALIDAVDRVFTKESDDLVRRQAPVVVAVDPLER